MFLNMDQIVKIGQLTLDLQNVNSKALVRNGGINLNDFSHIALQLQSWRWLASLFSLK